MKKNFSITSVGTICTLALFLVSFIFLLPVAEAQLDWDNSQPQPAAKPAKPAYTPPPDQLIYFKCGPKERVVAVTVTNINVPGLPPNLNYLKETDGALADMGYDMTNASARHQVDVRVTAKYIEIDNSKAVANEAGTRATVGAALGALGALALGGNGRDAAAGAAGGAVYGAATTQNATVMRYLTLEFEIASKAGGIQTGQVTKDISDPTLQLDAFIDGAIADYLEASFPKR